MAYAAMAIAESFSDKATRVLLMMDSLTKSPVHSVKFDWPRVSPSVLAIFPQLIGRASPSEKGPSTALDTVLVERDGMTERVVDDERSISDGYMILSRQFAGINHYRTKQMLSSVSHICQQITNECRRKVASKLSIILS
jgi:type III secretion protein N (ATPase)